MINVFSKTYTPKNEAVLNGAEFVAAKLNSSSKRKGRHSDPIMEKMIGNLVLQLVKGILGIVGIIAIGVSQNSGSKAVLVVGIAALLGAVSIHMYSKNKMQMYIYQDSFGEMKNAEQSSVRNPELEQLGVPADAAKIEAMFLLYEPNEVEFITYFNEPVLVYRENENLCFITTDEKLSIPVAEIRSIREIKKAAALDQWHKDIPFDQGIYKKYQIKSDASIYDQYYITTDYGRGVVIPNYYSIAVKDKYEILIPPYELDTVLELTGMQVAES